MGEPNMVLESAKPRLKRLAEVAAKLNQASDRYTAELKTIEAELNALNFGLEVELSECLTESAMEEEGEERYQIAKYLGYGKYLNGWGIVVHTNRELLEETGYGLEVKSSIRLSTTPLLDCSREIRRKSAEQILKLLDRLQHAATEAIANLERVMDARKS